MKVIGLTGGIAAGKSSVASILQSQCGATVLDADKFGHAAYKKGTPAYDSLVAHFGSAIVKPDDGEIERRELGKIVFADPAQMRALEAIVWPEILRLLQAELAKLESEAAAETAQVPLLVVVEAAIMLEAGWHKQLPLSALWVVTVPMEVARARLMARNAMTEEDAEKRIQAQMTNEERVAQADAVLDNSGDQDALARETLRLVGTI